MAWRVEAVVSQSSREYNISMLDEGQGGEVCGPS